MCGSEPESDLHLFLFGSVARVIWFGIAGVRTPRWCSSSMLEFFKNVFIWTTIDKSYLADFLFRMLIIFDTIWQLRNKVRVDGIQLDADSLVSKTRKYIFMYEGLLNATCQSNMHVGLQDSRAENEHVALSHVCSGFMTCLLMDFVLFRMILLLGHQLILINFFVLLSMQNMEQGLVA